MLKRLVMAALALLVAAAVADARPRRRPRRVPKPKARSEVQKKRIADGIRDHSLTKREAARLIAEQKKIKKMAKDVTDDGVVTRKEKAILDHAQTKASQHIAGERHDAQGTTGPKPRTWRTWDPGVNKRQHIQHLRIAQGIRSGSLTPAETRRLIGMESQIRRMERAMKSDGVLTAAERKTLHQALSDASKAIFGLKHNDPSVPRKVRPAVLALVNGDDFSEEDAQELLAQLRRLSEIRRLLAGPALPPDKRAELEAEFAELASQIFE